MFMWIHACLCLCFCVIRARCEWRTVQVWVWWAGGNRSPGEVKRWGPFHTPASVGFNPVSIVITAIHLASQGMLFLGEFRYCLSGSVASTNWETSGPNRIFPQTQLVFSPCECIGRSADVCLEALEMFLLCQTIAPPSWVLVSTRSRLRLICLCRGSTSCWLLHSGAHPGRACSGSS